MLELYGVFPCAPGASISWQRTIVILQRHPPPYSPAQPRFGFQLADFQQLAWGPFEGDA